MGSRELKEAIQRLRPGKGEAPRVDLSPVSTFDALLEQRMLALEQQVDELKGRINSLLFLVVGAVVVQLLLNLFT